LSPIILFADELRKAVLHLRHRYVLRR
jgi:hypothetical protein